MIIWSASGFIFLIFFDFVEIFVFGRLRLSKEENFLFELKYEARLETFEVLDERLPPSVVFFLSFNPPPMNFMMLRRVVN